MYSNVLEGILLTIGMYYWVRVPYIPERIDVEDKDQRRLYAIIFEMKRFRYEILARCFITLNFLVRSTSLIAWPAVFIYRLFTDDRPFYTKMLLNIYHAVLSLLIAALVDYSHYQKLTLSAYNFLHFNVLSQQSAFFGEEPISHLMMHFLP